MRLVKPAGIIGLLTPAGIYADKTAARFFQSVSTTGRVAGLFDFENRRPGTGLPSFFPDVNSRFKFCALIFGGRQFNETRCAFFLHDTETIDDPERCFPLTPADFARVNPNTGTAAVERRFPQSHGWTLGLRAITNSTNMRTCVAAIVPLSLTMAGAGNTLSLLVTDDPVAATCLLANLNAMCLDFVARCKMQGTSLNLYILEQFPVIARDSYARRFGPLPAAELVRDHVLRLTYTSHDMAPFAQALGYDGAPFVWDVEARRHLRARLDALYFHLYGLSREDADYVLGTFPIVRRQDEAEFGSYRTRELVLAYMNALTAGDVETEVDV